MSTGEKSSPYVFPLFLLELLFKKESEYGITHHDAVPVEQLPPPFQFLLVDMGWVLRTEIFNEKEPIPKN